MKIPIRLKFFVVLLAFSLGPIFISRGILGKAANRISADVSSQTRAELHTIVTSELEANAMSLLTILERGGRSMMLGVRMLAQQAGHVLEGHLPESGAKPYYTIDYADQDLIPPDAEYSDDYVKQTMSGKTRPIKISLGSSSIHLAHGVDEKVTTRQAEDLQRLLPTLKALKADIDDAPYWFNVALESGLFMTYPGHGSFPMMYDHRDQNWYQLAATSRSGDCTWDTPVVDPSTRKAMATVAFPIKDRQGVFIGAASIDVPISAMMSETELESRWEGDIQSFMVMTVPKGDSLEDGLLILAQQAYENGHRRHWMTGIDHDWLESDDKAGFEVLVQTMREKKSGVVRLPYKGVDSVWAFASNPEYSFMLIAPESVISQLPDQVAGSLTGLFDEMRDISAIISGVMLIITGFIAWFGSRTITKPILVMSRAARRLAGGDYSVQLDIRSGDERDELVDSFNHMVPKLKEHLRISKDLELAKEVQRLLLPTTTPEFPGFDISGGISYCDQTGGDYYDFINVNCETGSALGVVLGDVSGHGVPSALVMATARGQLHSLSQVVMAPEARIGAINKFLSNDLDGTGRFLTMFYLQLEEGTGTVRWVRAGHDPAIRFTPETGEFSELGGDGLALGVVGDFEFQGYEDTIEPGEVLTLATDGVWEARDSEGEMFGKERILAIIRDNAHKSSKDIRHAIMDGVSAYQANGQEDDIAVVVIKKT